jgi:hypothetical protein
MRKVLLSTGVILCIIGAAMASSRNIGIRVAVRQPLADTTPQDTSKKSFGYVSAAFADTTPKDTSKPQFGYVTSAFADTTPPDTAKKDFAVIR